MPLPKRKSPRWKEYDYTSPGGYFITICTKNKEHYFGTIRDGKMRLNELGKYCDQQIIQIEQQRKTVEIHEHIVMPNHVHILMVMNEFDNTINMPYVDYRKKNNQTNRRDSLLGCPHITENYISNGHAKSVSLQSKIECNPNYQGPKLGSIINMFKGNITKYAKQNDLPFQRQSRYHDHIIRNEKSYNNIKYYIQTNPEKWNDDIFYK